MKICERCGGMVHVVHVDAYLDVSLYDFEENYLPYMDEAYVFDLDECELVCQQCGYKNEATGWTLFQGEIVSANLVDQNFMRLERIEKRLLKRKAELENKIRDYREGYRRANTKPVVLKDWQDSFQEAKSELEAINGYLDISEAIENLRK